jgi:hypothetical protein
MICEATHTRINCFHRVRIGRVIAWHRITSQRSFWSPFRSGYSEQVDIWISPNFVENCDGSKFRDRGSRSNFLID